MTRIKTTTKKTTGNKQQVREHEILEGDLGVLWRLLQLCRQMLDHLTETSRWQVSC